MERLDVQVRETINGMLEKYGGKGFDTTTLMTLWNSRVAGQASQQGSYEEIDNQVNGLRANGKHGGNLAVLRASQ